MFDILEHIDLTSFTTLWYWIFLCLTWNSVTHRTMGVPFDMIIRADGDEARFGADLDALAHAQAHRLTYMFGRFGVVLIGVAAFVVGALAAAAFVLGIQLAQAMFVVALPVIIVWANEVRLAYIVRRGAGLYGTTLRRRIVRFRFYHQLIGLWSLVMAALGTSYYAFAMMSRTVP
ncbi:hypothetical protein FHS89_000810 [Rubricella aquisinus]|uniref:Component of SufBCD complex n=1 Tax=Rubricella aquisinus TaxID=2028108 RepID=A0A840WWU7_9RHOB|nr:hypothetical protein [Rubricella aquisinus]MBB5514804.1 hypothetical protein [Rubricella aquisinus]